MKNRFFSVVVILWVLTVIPTWGQDVVPSKDTLPSEEALPKEGALLVEGVEETFHLITVPTTSVLELSRFRVNLRYNHQTILLTGQPELDFYGEVELRAGVYPQGVATPTDVGLKFYLSPDSASFLGSVIDLRTKILSSSADHPALAFNISSTFHTQELNFVLLSLISSGDSGEFFKWSVGGQGGAALERARFLSMGNILVGGSFYLWKPFLEIITEYTGLLNWGDLNLGFRYNITPNLGIYLNTYSNIILTDIKANFPHFGGGLGWEF